MKKYQIILTAIISYFLFSQTSFAEAQKYVIEPTHTSVTWVFDHFGFSRPSGKFNNISGFILFDEANPQNSSTEITINTKGISTGVEKFDDHLKSKDFFDIKNFPIAKFVSKKIIVTSKNKAKIIGDLTILSTTKSITLEAIFNKSGINPVNQKPTIGFSAKASIKRSDFKVSYALPNIADKIDLIIELEANQ